MSTSKFKLLCSCITCKAETTTAALQRFHEHIKIITGYCENCNKELNKNGKFCSSSCAASSNNKNRTKESFLKQSNSLKKTLSLKSKPNIIEGPYTRIYLCTCKITGKKWYSPKVLKIHPDTISTINEYRYQCRFTFSMRNYPEWFSYVTDLIKQHGWYSAKNKSDNPNGCSRDHLYSVAEGFKNGIDPKLLAHPANCHVKPHKKNQSKYSNSDITIEQLLTRISEFEKLYGTGYQICTDVAFA